MRTVVIILLGTFIVASSLPSIAGTNTASTPVTEKSAAPLSSSDTLKQDAKDHPPSSDGTPAVVVDDNEVENLLGRDVKSAAGEKLGQITDVIVGRSGDVRAAVIDFGGFLGMGSRKVAVAWGSLKFSKDAIVVDMTRDELRVTPEYRPGEPIVIAGAQHDQTPKSPPPAVKPPAAK